MLKPAYSNTRKLSSRACRRITSPKNSHPFEGGVPDRAGWLSKSLYSNVYILCSKSHPEPVEGQNRILEYLHKCTHALQMSKAHLVSVTKTSPYGCASTLVFYINFQILNVTLSLSKGKPHRHAELDSASHPRTPNSELPTSHHLKPKT